MISAQARAAIEAALEELDAGGDGYVSDNVAALTGLPVGVLDARGVFWNVVLVTDGMEQEWNE